MQKEQCREQLAVHDVFKHWGRGAALWQHTDKSNIRNSTLLQIFTDLSRGGTTDRKRTAKNMTQNRTVRGPGNLIQTKERICPANLWAFWQVWLQQVFTTLEKKTGDSVKLILYRLLPEAQQWAQRSFDPEKAVQLQALFQIPEETKWIPSWFFSNQTISRQNWISTYFK